MSAMMADQELKELFGRRLKYWLSVRGYKQADLCERFGVSSATASDWCNGKKMPRADKLNALASWLGIELSDLMQDLAGGISYHQNEYYINDETAQIAQEIFENKELRGLFDVARKASASDLQTAYDVLLALKRKEGYSGDDPA